MSSCDTFILSLNFKQYCVTLRPIKPVVTSRPDFGRIRIRSRFRFNGFALLCWALDGILTTPLQSKHNSQSCLQIQRAQALSLNQGMDVV